MVWIVLLSLFLLKTRYKLIHYFSMVVCTAGLIILILEDLKSSNSDDNSFSKL